VAPAAAGLAADGPTIYLAVYCVDIVVEKNPCRHQSVLRQIDEIDGSCIIIL
jgi:hypothetical protein